VVHGDGEIAGFFDKGVVLGFTEGWILSLVVDGLVGEGVEFVDAGLHGGLLLGREWRGFGLAALDVFDVDLGEKPQFLELRDGEDIATWSLLDVSPSTDFTAACAVRMPRAKAVTYRFGAL
jgi:hypothetical protein